jgi:hypothetical protein
MTYPCERCIIDLMKSCGPQDISELRAECRVQAVPYTQDLFFTALADLLDQGKLIVVENEGDPYYDFPDSYYEEQLK